MLEITIPACEMFDDRTQEFLYTKETTLNLEHSLLSISKWEARWNKPFISFEEKTNEEALDYIKCMTLNKHVDPMVYTALTGDNIAEINRYIDLPMTASDVYMPKSTGARETITSETIYYWMIKFGVPFECQKWHLNRLIALIKVCEAKEQPPTKMSRGELLRRNAELNAARRKKLQSSG